MKHRDFPIEVPLFFPKKIGADVIELGVPFSDPMADGSAIEAASVVAIKNGALATAAARRGVGQRDGGIQWI